MFKKRQTFSVSTPNHISKLKDLSLLVLKFYQFNENAEHRWNHGQVTVKAGVLTSVHIVGKGKPICFKKDCKTKRSYCKVPPCRMVPLKREYFPLFHCVLRNGVEEYSLNDSHVGELVLCLSHFNMEEVQHFYAHKELPLGALPGAESTVMEWKSESTQKIPRRGHRISRYATYSSNWLSNNRQIQVLNLNKQTTNCARLNNPPSK